MFYFCFGVPGALLLINGIAGRVGAASLDTFFAVKVLPATSRRVEFALQISVNLRQNRGTT